MEATTVFDHGVSDDNRTSPTFCNQLKRTLRFIASLAGVLIVCSALAPAAYAACASPVGAAGEIIYNTDHNTVQFCDGSNWMSMSGTVASESDPQVGAVTNNQWCRGNGTSVECDQAAPSGATSSGAAGFLQLSGGSGAFASSSATAGNELFWKTSNHSLGIGTINPLFKLHVQSPTDNTTHILTSVGGNGRLSIATDASGNSILQSLNNLDLYLGTATSASQMTIKYGGNVGVGTTAPNAKFVVSANAAGAPTPASVTLAQFVSGDGTNHRVLIDGIGAGANLTLRSSGTGSTIASPVAMASGAQLGALAFFGYGATGYTASNRAAVIVNASENWTDTAQGTYMTFNTTPNGAAASAERLRIDHNGNVGIGTTSPGAYKLFLNESVANTDGRLMVQGTGDINAAGVSLKNADNSKLWDVTVRAGSSDDLWFSGFDGSAWRTPMVITQTGKVYIKELCDENGANCKDVSTGWAGGGGGTLATLTDVDVTGVANNSLLRYDSGASKWTDVLLQDGMGATTMVSGWPDAIYCTLGGTADKRAFYAAFMPYSGSGNYYYFAPEDVSTSTTSMYTWIHFSSSGAFGGFASTRSGSPYTDAGNCNNKTVSQLYASGQAFNFVGGGSPWTKAGSLVHYMGGNVGIGTTGPGQALSVIGNAVIGAADRDASGNAALEVRGSGQIDVYAAGAGLIDFTDGTPVDFDGRIRYDHAARALQLYTAQTERLRIDLSGNVGIGTTTVDYAGLQVGAGGTGGAKYLTLNGGTGTGGGSAVLFGANSTPPYDVSIGHYSAIYGGALNKALTLYSPTTNVLIPNGNVSIGDTNPQAKLAVNGNLESRGSSITIHLNTCGGACGSYHALSSWVNVGAIGYAWATAQNTNTSLFAHNGAGTITVARAGLYRIRESIMMVPVADLAWLAYACPFINGGANCGASSGEPLHGLYHGGSWAGVRGDVLVELGAGATVQYGYHIYGAMSNWGHDGYTSLTVTRVN